MRRPSPPFCGAPTRAARGAAAGSVAETPGLRCARCAVPRAGADAPPRPITQPCLLQPEGPDSQVRAGHVPPVLPRVRQGHRLREGACAAGARGAARRPAALPNPRVGREDAGLRREADATPLACAEPLNRRAARAARAACGGARRAGGVARCLDCFVQTQLGCAPGRRLARPSPVAAAPRVLYPLHAACVRHNTSAVRRGSCHALPPRPSAAPRALAAPADVARGTTTLCVLRITTEARAPRAPHRTRAQSSTAPASARLTPR